MKWLLISNEANPGDIWVRKGVEEIVLRLDRNARFLVRERDYREGDPFNGLKQPKERFDFSVICGMPLVWCHREPGGPVSSTTQHDSWPALSGWCSRRKKMIIAGFGIFAVATKESEYSLLNMPEIAKHIQDKLFSRCRLVYARSPFARIVFPGIDYLPCPSICAVRKPAQSRQLKLCNFMPGGCHYPTLVPEATKAMNQVMPSLAKQLIDAGFIFMAHRNAEHDLAIKLGWKGDQIRTFNDGRGPLLDVYRHCGKYIGNRIHGGIISRAVSADVIVIGSDSRLHDVAYMGGQTYDPRKIPDFSSWISRPAEHTPFALEEHVAAHVQKFSDTILKKGRG